MTEEQQKLRMKELEEELERLKKEIRANDALIGQLEGIPNYSIVTDPRYAAYRWNRWYKSPRRASGKRGNTYAQRA